MKSEVLWKTEDEEEHIWLGEQPIFLQNSRARAEYCIEALEKADFQVTDLARECLLKHDCPEALLSMYFKDQGNLDSKVVGINIRELSELTSPKLMRSRMVKVLCFLEEFDPELNFDGLFWRSYNV